MATHMDTGREGEQLAQDYLTRKGYRILATNYRFQRSEVDIIAFLPDQDYTKGGELVFVEVKTRRGTGFGHPEEAVTPEKQRHLIRAAKAWLHENKMDRTPCRFDVLAVQLPKGGPPDFHHLENAFWTF